MTPAEAIAIHDNLQRAQCEVQEVHLRLRCHRDSTVTMDDASIANSLARMEKAIEAIALVNKMAIAELPE